MKKELAKVDSLKQELEDAKQTILKLADTNNSAKTLHSTIKALEQDLQKERSAIQALQHDLDKANALNAKLSETAKRGTVPQRTVKKTAASATLQSKRSGSLTPASRRRAPSAQPGAAPTVPTKFLSTESKFKRIRKASVDYSQSGKTLSDKEIGWFD